MCTGSVGADISAYDIVPQQARVPRQIPRHVNRVFLTAEWQYLAMLNYRVSPELLLPYVPLGTELDLWQGAAYVSVVGFYFARTRLAGLPIPFHRNFEEVNLRFYVRREVGGETRRAVSFIKEFVPRLAIATLARLAYNEPYLAVPMRHAIDHTGAATDPPRVKYEWKAKSGWCAIALDAEGGGQPLQTGSEQEFIAQHYWGYTRQRDGGTIEYEVRHPAWNVWRARSAALTGDLSDLYPSEFLSALRGEPHSAFLAHGSAVSVHTPVRLDT
jgi:uncharacterized protein YqjF (DUF2071 family)